MIEQRAFLTTKPLDGWGDPNQGMNLRDWFAGQALVAMPLLNDGAYSQLARDFGDPERDAKQCATAAYRYADAMLAERSKP